MKQSNVIKGTLAVVALVAALVVGVAVHMHSVGSPTAGHSTQNTAKTATETTAKTAESITADYPGYSSAEEGVKAAGLVVTGVPLDSRERILYPEIDFTSGTPETNPQYGLTEDDIDMDALGVPETVTRVRVTKVIKGDAKVGDIIEVAQVGGVDKSGIVRRETSTTLLNEAKASGTAEFLLLLNEYDVVYNAINPISGALGVDTDGHVTALKSSGESGGIGESRKEYTNAVSWRLVRDHPENRGPAGRVPIHMRNATGGAALSIYIRQMFAFRVTGHIVVA